MGLKEIIEGNKIICDFLKMKISSHSNSEHPIEVMFSEIWKPFYIKANISDESIKGDSFYSHYIKFHSSWDWLIPCIGKISHQCEEPEELDGLKYALLCDDINTAWKFVVDYLKNK